MIRFCDTTLRDGEQAAGVAFGPDEKLEIARLLDEAGVDEIEAGTAVMGGDEAEAIRRIARAGLRARVFAWNRALVKDIEASLACGVDSVAISLPVSELLIETKLEKTYEQVLDQLGEAIAFARSRGLFVCVGAEDASRADAAFLFRFAVRAREAGAQRVRLSDTVGRLDPFAARERVEALVAVSRFPVEFHGHNDFGLATANTLAAVRGGAAVVSTTVLGLGERAGCAALEEVALALRYVHKEPIGLRLEVLPRLCRRVAELAGIVIPAGKPIVGGNAFAHESGIHVAGILRDPRTYEPFPPEEVGLERVLVVGKHSGSRGLQHVLASLGVIATHEEAARLAVALGSRRGEIGPGCSVQELLALWRKVEGREGQVKA